ncbi:putative O-linked N-acetylglucosamine transferase (SPINDLY family) [Azospirillum agricola]|uniref:O-linked N-acetylglucosamine transferase, SPINDLY family protein n=1 Tax=Azospirillum agricola TaxID=1720247 RepID=UPI001AE1527F|nr:glycosyltransferase family 41 protein [Azospirillum agricola]MBP2229054.1 putative O-linked N-acetylglucosamine transferase (SPINDLY family) [Azospirillum agricola]
MTSTDTLDTLLNDGRRALIAGELETANHKADAVLAVVSRQPQALYLKATAAAMAGNPASAVALFQASIAAGGGTPECHYNLAQALHRTGDHAGAERAYLAAILRAPGFADAYNGLGVTLAAVGRVEDAIAAFRRAVAEQPRHADAGHNLASMLTNCGRHDEVFVLYRDWLDSDPGNERLIFLTGTAALMADCLPEAETYLRRVLLRQPRDAAAWNNLALTLAHRGLVGEAIEAFAKAVEIRPDYLDALFGMASSYQAAGQEQRALETYEQVRALVPEFVEIDSNILMSLNYSDTLSPEEIYDRHRRWGDETLRRRGGLPAPVVPAQLLMGRRLRIGYVSPDFRLHSVAMFLLPLLRNHDRSRVELFAYSHVEKTDFITEEILQQMEHWRSINGLTADKVADLIREDGIDLLIDLAGHTGRNRLDVFARRPAPVQATWLGYPATTGLATVDVRFTDAVADPPGETNRWHVERLERLEHFLCYGPLGPTPDPLPLPMLERDHVTFGSFNALSKLNDATAALWSRVLRAVQGSRLVLKSKVLIDPAIRDRVTALFAGHGVAPERLTLLSHINNHFGHLDAYGDIDIALDPMPYNGTTTTCEALWMGVPVLTLPGNVHAARVGASLLTAAGLTDWIAAGADDFVAKAVALTAVPRDLSDIRAGLRARLQASPLCDGAAFARHFEAGAFAALTESGRISNGG